MKGKRAILSLLWAGAILVVGVACGDASTQAGAQQGVAGEATLPTLPPPSVLEPGLYDKNGCAYIGPNEVDCPAATLPPGIDTSYDEHIWSSFLGFDGPLYAQSLSGEAAVLTDSITTPPGDVWTAMGLVRDETPFSATITVTATLVGQDGETLDTLSVAAQPSVLRSGEPGVFEIESRTPMSEVATVRWDASSIVAADTGVRDFRILQLHTYPSGERPRERFDPPGVESLPYVLYGSVDPLTSQPVGSVAVLAAWVDPELRVVTTTTTTVGEIPNDTEGSVVAPDVLDPRVMGDFYLSINNAALANRATSGDIAPIIWVVGQVAK